LCPTRRLYNSLQLEITDTFGRLFVGDQLNEQLVPHGSTLKLRVYDPSGSGGNADYPFASRAQFVKVLTSLRKGARGIFCEAPADAQRHAAAQLQSLCRGGRQRLMPGARAWNLLKTDETGEVLVLCGRAGPHTPRLAEAIGGMRGASLLGQQPLQEAQTEAAKRAEVRQLKEHSAAMEAALVQGAAAGTHAPDAAKLIELAAKRGCEPERVLLPRLEILAGRLATAGLREEAEAFIRSRLELTKHEVRPEVIGGALGGARCNSPALAMPMQPITRTLTPITSTTTTRPRPALRRPRPARRRHRPRHRRR
jgi:hypothetical protein